MCSVNCYGDYASSGRLGCVFSFLVIVVFNLRRRLVHLANLLMLLCLAMSPSIPPRRCKTWAFESFHGHPFTSNQLNCVIVKLPYRSIIAIPIETTQGFSKV